MSMKIGLSLKHHDHEYVEQRGGFLLLTHMRAADGRASYRQAALDRALAGFDSPTGAAAGFVVLQRAMLCVEDLGCQRRVKTDPPPPFEN